MNITNILNRRLGLVTVANLQRVFNYFSNSLGLVDGAIPDSRPYKVYTALLSQSGTDAPTAVVLENTLGAVPVWSRTEAGTYRVTLTNGFTITKTTVDAFLYRSSALNFIDTITVEKISNSVVEFLTFASFGSARDGSSFQVEIRVYN